MQLCSIPRSYHEMVSGADSTVDGVKMLVEFGASMMEYRDERNITDLMAAMKAENDGIAMHIMENTPTFRALFRISLRLTIYSAIALQKEYMAFLNAFLNAVDIDGEAAMSEAIRHGNLNVADELLALRWTSTLSGAHITALQAEMAHRTEHSSVRLGSTRFDRVEQGTSVRWIESNRSPARFEARFDSTRFDLITGKAVFLQFQCKHLHEMLSFVLYVKELFK